MRIDAALTAATATATVVALQLACISVCGAPSPSHLSSLSLVQPEWGYYFEQGGQGEGSYSFGYDVEDGATGNAQFRRERRLPNGTVTGSYGLVEPDGNVRVAHYTADPHTGYRVTIENSQRPDERHPPDGPLASLPPPPPASSGSDNAFRHATAAWPPPPDDRRTPPASRDYASIWNGHTGDR